MDIYEDEYGAMLTAAYSKVQLNAILCDGNHSHQ
jgi:hypothetical protein